MVDIDYWGNFYKNEIKDIKKPSDFCLFIYSFFKDKDNVVKLLDSGCGNGRDSFYFSKKFTVIALDTSLPNLEPNKNVIFLKKNFCDYEKNGFDIIYSRFTFHSLRNEDQVKFIKSIKNKGTYLCIETRSDKNKEIDFEFKGEHFRNPTNINNLKELLENNNFNILYIKEDKNFAIYKNENPICIRVICIKE